MNRLNFDLKKYYERIGAAKDRLEQIRIEAEWFRYYDSLSKEEQQEFWQLDRAVRREVADDIAASLRNIKTALTELNQT